VSAERRYITQLAALVEPLCDADPFRVVRGAANEAIAAAAFADGLPAVACQVAETLRHLESVITEAEAAREALAATLRDVMDETGMTSIRVRGGTWYLRDATPRVIVQDEAAIPAELLVQPPPRPDLSAIRAALRNGRDVPGATLTNGGPPSLCFRAHQGDKA
jgi:hypothetical protein